MTLVDLFLIFATKLHSIRNREYFHIARSRDPHHHRCRYSYKTVRIIHEYMHTHTCTPIAQHTNTLTEFGFVLTSFTVCFGTMM